jgi:glycosyltransferase involved in cell wall biosynthesis
MNPSKRIRVLLTVPHLNRTASPYREMAAIAKHINKEDFDLTVCALRDAGHEETGPFLERLGVSWFVTPFRSRKRTVREFQTNYQAQKEIARRGPFDIQHSLDFTSSPLEAIAARMWSRPYIYNQRNMNENGHPLALRIKFRFSSQIIAIADHVREFLVEQGASPKKLIKIRNGIDLEDTDRELAAAKGESSELILVLGQIEPRKRHQDIIQAMVTLQERHPAMRLAIAGNVYDQGYLDELRRLVDELGLQGKVEFLGGRNDVPQLLRQARALVLCSESEGLPWVILEAMAARVPFVGSDIKAHREIIRSGRTGMLAPLGEPSGYAAALDRVLSDPAFAQSLTSQARAVLERDFSATGMVRQLERMYRDVMTGRTRPGFVKEVLVASTGLPDRGVK